MYLLHTTAELCISPVGLSMITKLSPMRLVGTVPRRLVFGHGHRAFTASIIAQFTRVGDGENRRRGHPAAHRQPCTPTGDVFGYCAGCVRLRRGLPALGSQTEQLEHEGETA
jgi:hypothetical protein